MMKKLGLLKTEHMRYENVQRVYQDENDIKGEENNGQREQEERVGS